MRSTFLLAQNLGEYSGVGGAVSDGLARLRDLIDQQIRDMSPTGWALIGGALVLLWLVFRFRR
jgi:hypothetical protein